MLLSSDYLPIYIQVHIYIYVHIYRLVYRLKYRFIYINLNFKAEITDLSSIPS